MTFQTVETSSGTLRSRWLSISVVVSVLFSLWLMIRMVSEVRGSISAIEILCLVPLPLAVFYARSTWSRRARVTGFIVVTVLWFFTYSLLHEFSHLAGSVLLGRRITAYQLIPRYWEGEFFSGAGVASEPIAQLGKSLGFLAGLAPYIKDIVLLVIGCLILKPKKIVNPFLSGLILILCCLSSVFDIVNNYSIYPWDPDTAGNDFQGTALAIGLPSTHVIAVTFALLSLSATFRILILYKGFPQRKDILTI